MMTEDKERGTILSPWIIAHRGASAEKPENTIEAFQRAIEVGAHCLELDVHLSREGVPVCRHDAVFGPNAVMLSDLTIKEMKALPNGHNIPTLEQVLNLDRGQVELFIELKGEGCRWPRHLVEKVVELLDFFRGFRHSRPFLGSFSIAILRELAQRWPAENLVGIVEYECEIEPALALGVGVLAIEQSLATTARLKQIQVPVWVWTVDDTKRVAELTCDGVSGIITNQPAEVIERRNHR